MFMFLCDAFCAMPAADVDYTDCDGRKQHFSIPLQRRHACQTEISAPHARTGATGYNRKLPVYCLPIIYQEKPRWR
jgi:hypothetical protein